MAEATLVLRDIHQPPAPPWWPPAPGWWVLAGVLLLAVVLLAWWYARQRRRRRQLATLFDSAVAATRTPAEEVAAISGLLRRAARRRDLGADRLRGEAWLEFLDQDTRAGRRKPRDGGFVDGSGRLLLDGGYRRDVPADQVLALRPRARALFLQWMAGR